MDDMYREYILDHYQHPHNFGELENPTFEAEGVNPLCGDQIRVQAKVDDNECICDLRFTGNGCAISQASMSILSDKLMGMKLAEVENLTRDDIIDMLGIQLSPMRIKCAVLGLVVTKTGMHEHAGTEAPAGWDGMDELAWQK